MPFNWVKYDIHRTLERSGTYFRLDGIRIDWDSLWWDANYVLLRSLPAIFIFQ